MQHIRIPTAFLCTGPFAISPLLATVRRVVVKLLTSQRYDVLSAVEAANQVVLEVQWTGVLAVPLGTLPAGGEMRCKSAMFLDFRDRRIARQRNYDSFDPW